MRGALRQCVDAIEGAYLDGPRIPIDLRHAGSTPHQRYENAKAAWVSANPGATPAEYTAAMVRIAKVCGV